MHQYSLHYYQRATSLRQVICLYSSVSLLISCAVHTMFAYGKLRVCAMKKWDGTPISFQNIRKLNECIRPREAIECLRRALLGADPADTQITFRLAKLHDEVQDYAPAVAYHQRIIDISTSERN